RSRLKGSDKSPDCCHCGTAAEVLRTVCLLTHPHAPLLPFGHPATCHPLSAAMRGPGNPSPILEIVIIAAEPLNFSHLLFVRGVSNSACKKRERTSTSCRSESAHVADRVPA